MPIEPFIDDQIADALELIERDRTLGMERLKTLAMAGRPTAVLYFALALSEEPDRDSEEREWLLRANELGFADAAWNLAMIHHQDGDLKGVKRWIDRAAELGNTDAAFIARTNYDVKRFLSAQH